MLGGVGIGVHFARGWTQQREGLLQGMLPMKLLSQFIKEMLQLIFSHGWQKEHQ